LLARSGSVLDLAEELRGIATQGSLTHLEDLKLLVDNTLTQFGRIDAVVNSFGDPPRPDLLTITDQEWVENFEMLFLSVVRLARLVTPIMQGRGGGVIVNISACDAQEPSLGTPYSGTLRLAMEGFTKLYGKRYRQDRIRMISLAPHFVGDHPDEFAGWTLPSDFMWGRPSTYAEFAQVVAFLLSEDAKFISGTTLKVDEAYSNAV
jgi:NAD(P)-dependent dehydrogenase (short-subunit alcohol dehydrogenase family)